MVSFRKCIIIYVNVIFNLFPLPEDLSSIYQLKITQKYQMLHKYLINSQKPHTKYKFIMNIVNQIFRIHLLVVSTLVNRTKVRKVFCVDSPEAWKHVANLAEILMCNNKLPFLRKYLKQLQSFYYSIFFFWCIVTMETTKFSYFFLIGSEFTARVTYKNK